MAKRPLGDARTVHHALRPPSNNRPPTGVFLRQAWKISPNTTRKIACFSQIAAPGTQQQSVVCPNVPAGNAITPGPVEAVCERMFSSVIGSASMSCAQADHRPRPWPSMEWQQRLFFWRWPSWMSCDYRTLSVFSTTYASKSSRNPKQPSFPDAGANAAPARHVNRQAGLCGLDHGHWLDSSCGSFAVTVAPNPKTGSRRNDR